MEKNLNITMYDATAAVLTLCKKRNTDRETALMDDIYNTEGSPWADEMPSNEDVIMMHEQYLLDEIDKVLKQTDTLVDSLFATKAMLLGQHMDTTEIDAALESVDRIINLMSNLID